MLTSAHAPTRAVKLLLLCLLNLILFAHNIRADSLTYKALLAMKNYEQAQTAYIAYLEAALYAFVVANAILTVISGYLLFGDDYIQGWINKLKQRWRPRKP